MTFSQPYSGVFAYQGIIPSAAMNYLNTQFANSLDKTGDNATNGGGVTGRVDWLSGSSLKVADGASVFMDGYMLFNGNGVYTTSAEFANGAALQLDSTSNMAIYCEVDYKSGSFLNMDSGATFEVDSGSFIVGTFSWKSSAGAPQLTQGSAFSGAGKSFNISAQSTSASSQSGGNVTFNSGTGGSGGALSAVIMQPVGVGGSLVAYPFQGTANSQRQAQQIWTGVITTASSGSPVTVLSIPMATISSAQVRVSWIRRNTGGSGCLGNECGIVAVCNGGGTLAWSGPKEYVSPTAAFDSASTALTITNSPNLLIIQANQIAADDWQFVVTINYN